jgi:uncharacterized oxidoreductase
MVRLMEKSLREFCVSIFKAAGALDDEAKIVTDILVDTSIHGVDSHGVRAIPRYINEIEKGVIVPGTPIKSNIDTPTTAMWDVGKGFGFVAGYKAIQTAIMKASKYKMGSVGIMGPGHIGALYWYSYEAAKNDMIGMTFCRGVVGRPKTAPYGGVEGRLGVNPLSVAIPTGSKYKPIVLDMAMTGVAMGHLQVMALKGETVPEGWLIKSDGSWSEDPLAVVKGEANPVAFGHPHSEYKGYGLSVVIEALAGAIGSGCGLIGPNYGHLFMVIDPTGYCPIKEFTDRIDSMIEHLKSSRKRPGFEEIFYPGEPEWREEERRSLLGIYVDETWWENIIETADKLGVKVPRTIYI